jgi:hypothetical protein
MANEVYANGMELACKAGSGKTICAMPDVCFTPPENPATPPGVPVPYPNTGFDSDTTEGSKTVMISGKEIMLKNKSYFKKSTGDEAGCAAKKGMLSSTNTGKVYFVKWSMDVKFEAENVDRHLDMTTDNHNSPNANEAAPWTFIYSAAIPPPGHPCEVEINTAKRECASSTVEDGKRKNCTEKCKDAMNCILVPKRKDKEMCCDPHNTGHHLVPAHCCKGIIPNYKEDDAPTVCAGGWSWHRNDKSSVPADQKTHPQLHEIQDPIERKIIRVMESLGKSRETPWKYKTVRNIGIRAHQRTFKPPCSTECLKSQLDNYHLEDSNENPPLKATKYGNKIDPNDPVFKNYPK